MPHRQLLIQLLETFVANQNRSRELVREIETKFYECKLQEDDRFFDLMYALDMFDVPMKDYGYDEKMLASECKYALKLLRQEI